MDHYFRKFIPISYSKGETILRPEDTPQGVYYLKSGFVRNYSVTKDGKEITLNIFKPDTYFPLQWALSDITNQYFYEAMSKVALLRIPKNDFVKKVSSNQKLLNELFSRIFVQLEIVYIRMNHMFGDNAYKKVTSTLLFMAKRFGKKQKRGVSISIPATHFCIASIAGTTRETASAIMKKLSKQGSISYSRKRIVVKKFEKLEKETT